MAVLRGREPDAIVPLSPGVRNRLGADNCALPEQAYFMETAFENDVFIS
jgi:hypothetical protein